MRGLKLPGLRRRRNVGTPTVGIDERELRRLFGEPALVRRVALPFDLAQLLGRFPLAVFGLAALPSAFAYARALYPKASSSSNRTCGTSCGSSCGSSCGGGGGGCGGCGSSGGGD
jgi:uncharacterized membrane protein YgcG